MGRRLDTKGMGKYSSLTFQTPPCLPKPLPTSTNPSQPPQRGGARRRNTPPYLPKGEEPEGEKLKAKSERRKTKAKSSPLAILR